MADKLYVVTRKDLSNGCQIVQTAHAVANFFLQRPYDAGSWCKTSNVLVVLEVDTYHQLLELTQTSEAQLTYFREPDLCDEMTAVAFTPSPLLKKMFSKFRLAQHSPIMLDAQEQLVARERMLYKLSQTAPLAQNKLTREAYFELVDHLRGKVDLQRSERWKFPPWLESNRKQILQLLPHPVVMDRYLTLVNCGATAADCKSPDNAFGANMDVAYLILHDTDLFSTNVLPNDESFFNTPFAMGQIIAALVQTNLLLQTDSKSKIASVQFKRVCKRGVMLFDYLITKTAHLFLQRFH
jgi:hypothetical protein